MPSVSAAPEPTAADTDRATALLESTVNGLLLRSAPSLGADPFVFPCNPVGGCTDPVVINDGWTMVALDGPVVADGYEWHLVQLSPEHPGSAYLGWVANPVSGDDWLTSSTYECPTPAPELNAAIDMGAGRLLHCSGAEQLAFEGFVVQGFGCNVLDTFEPAWLAHPCANMSFISPARTSDGDGRLFLHYPAPGVLNPTLEMGAGEPVRIEGHFDDRAATTCRLVAIEEESPSATGLAQPDPRAEIARCRLRFVVTDVENLIAQ
jgi:hypothetical protein